MTAAIGLLDASRSLTAKDRAGLQEWFGKFLAWMQDSKKGKDNSKGRFAALMTYAICSGRGSSRKSCVVWRMESVMARANMESAPMEPPRSKRRMR